jgi:hypothetical protein
LMPSALAGIVTLWLGHDAANELGTGPVRRFSSEERGG